MEVIYVLSFSNGFDRDSSANCGPMSLKVVCVQEVILLNSKNSEKFKRFEKFGKDLEMTNDSETIL